MAPTSAPRENTPLLASRSSSPSPNSSPTATITGNDEKRHYNLAGLDVTTFWVLCISMWFCAFLNAFDGSVVATLLGPISSSFLATNSASWLGTSYMLAVCCFTPIYGRLCNIIGRQGSLMIALVIFGLGNTLCAVAPSMKFLIGARALAGLGGGGLTTVGSTIMSDLVPITHRAIFQGYANIMFGLGMGLGAPLGGFINDAFGWRWAFYLQIPLIALALVVTYFKVHYTIPTPGNATPRAKQTAYQAFRRIDFLGCFLLAGWVGAGLIAISLKTNSTSTDAYEWSSPTLLALFATSAVLFVVFLFVELKWAAEPVMPFELLHRRTPISVAANNFFISIVALSSYYAVPLFFTTVRQMTASNAGRHLIPNSVVGTLGSIGCGFIVRNTGKYYWLTAVTSFLCIVGAVLIATWDESSSEWMLWTNMAVMNFSMGSVTTLTVTALIGDVGREYVAVATSLSYVARTIGQVLGVALSGSLSQAVLQRELTARITGPKAEDVIASIRQSSESISNLPPMLKAAAITSYQRALHAVFLVGIVLSVVQFLAVLGIKEVDMRPKPIKRVEEEEQA